jgi:hypothetical protein
MPEVEGGWQSSLKGSDTEARVSAVKRGGTTGQVLAKASDNDLDTEWTDVASSVPDNRLIPAGGADGQVLAKASVTDYDTEWVDQSGGGGSSEYLTFVPQDAATMPNLTLFVDSADNGLKFKDHNGVLLSVGLAPG